MLLCQDESSFIRKIKLVNSSIRKCPILSLLTALSTRQLSSVACYNIITIITGFPVTQEWVRTSRNVILIVFRFLHCLQIHHYKFQFNQSFLALRDKKIKIIKEVSHNMQLTYLTLDKMLAVIRTDHAMTANVHESFSQYHYGQTDQVLSTN